jgi:hypothetical protein
MLISNEAQRSPFVGVTLGILTLLALAAGEANRPYRAFTGRQAASVLVSVKPALPQEKLAARPLAVKLHS